MFKVMVGQTEVLVLPILECADPLLVAGLSELYASEKKPLVFLGFGYTSIILELLWALRKSTANRQTLCEIIDSNPGECVSTELRAALITQRRDMLIELLGNEAVTIAPETSLIYICSSG